MKLWGPHPLCVLCTMGGKPWKLLLNGQYAFGERVVSATVILLEETDFAGMNEEWIKWFPADPPARQGAKLPVRIPGLKVSIAAIAEV
jgi:hypothetical protein